MAIFRSVFYLFGNNMLISRFSISNPLTNVAVHVILFLICLLGPVFMGESLLSVPLYILIVPLLLPAICASIIVLYFFYVSVLADVFFVQYVTLYILFVFLFLSLWPIRLSIFDNDCLRLCRTYNRPYRLLFWLYCSVLACHMMLKNSDLVLSLVLLICLGSMYHHLSFLRLTRFRLGTGVNILLLSVSIVVGVLIMEAGARVLWGKPEGSRQLYMPHSRYMFLINPGGKDVYEVQTRMHAYKKVSCLISEQGFRDRPIPVKEPDEKRVLLLGDSFTMGHAVDEEDTISRILETKIRTQRNSGNITVINGGMNAAGPFQALGMLKERGMKLEPDFVVLQLFLFNDLDDSLMTVGKAQRTFFAPTRVIINTLYQQSSFPFRLEYFLRRQSRLYTKLVQTCGGDSLVANSLAAMRFFPEAAPLAFVPLEPGLSSLLDINRLEWYPELYEGLELTIQYTEQIYNLCQRAGIGFAVYCIPAFEEISDPHWQALVNGYDGDEVFEPLHAMRIAEKRMKEKNIPFFSVVEYLKSSPLSVEVLYYIYDGHLTAKGNEVVAEAIGHYLKDTFDAF